MVAAAVAGGWTGLFWRAEQARHVPFPYGEPQHHILAGERNRAWSGVVLFFGGRARSPGFHLRAGRENSSRSSAASLACSARCCRCVGRDRGLAPTGAVWGASPDWEVASGCLGATQSALRNRAVQAGDGDSVQVAGRGPVLSSSAQEMRRQTGNARCNDKRAFVDVRPRRGQDRRCRVWETANAHSTKARQTLGTRARSNASRKSRKSVTNSKVAGSPEGPSFNHPRRKARAFAIQSLLPEPDARRRARSWPVAEHPTARTLESPLSGFIGME